jgi:hypothetical protein
MEQKALNSDKETQKSWFRVVVGFGLRTREPQWVQMIGGHPSMATVWGRGRRRRKVHILAAGQDTAAERWSQDDHHGQ